MKVRYVLDPLVDGLDALLAVVHLLYGSLLLRRVLRNGPELEVKHRRIALLRGRLVEDSEADELLLAVRPRDLYEGVDVSHGRNVLGDEGLEPGLQFDRLRRVPKKYAGFKVLESWPEDSNTRQF